MANRKKDVVGEVIVGKEDFNVSQMQRQTYYYPTISNKQYMSKSIFLKIIYILHIMIQSQTNIIKSIIKINYMYMEKYILICWCLDMHTTFSNCILLTRCFNHIYIYMLKFDLSFTILTISQFVVIQMRENEHSFSFIYSSFMFTIITVNRDFNTWVSKHRQKLYILCLVYTILKKNCTSLLKYGVKFILLYINLIIAQLFQTYIFSQPKV